MKTPSLNGIKMNVIKTAGTGVVNSDTIFDFQETENIVTAAYSGGLIARGFLAGIRQGERLNFTFCQLQTDGQMDNGLSHCVLSLDGDALIILTESFEWKSRDGSPGENIFRQIEAPLKSS